MKRRVFILFLSLCLLCACSPQAQSAAADTGFFDVAADAWYAEAAEYCRDSGLMNGTSATVFSPDQATSRAMLAAILYRQAGSPAATAVPNFADTPADAWYASALSWATANGVISGYADGRFGPDDPITRQQMAAILWRYAGSPAPGENQTFADQTSISSYAAEAVAWARSSGVMNGRDGNRFDPGGTATRAQTAAILHRWLSGGTPVIPETGSRILVAYFSRTGNTQGVAETLAALTGGDLFEIVPQTAYPSDYNDALQQAQQELRADARPALSSHVADIEQYDAILLGFPIWHGNAPMPICSFLEEYDLSGKTVAPFSTSGSSGIGTAMSAIRSLCPDADVADGLSITSSTLNQADALASAWVDVLDLAGRENTQNAEGQTPSAENVENNAMPALQIQVGDRSFTAALSDTPATRALLERLPMTLDMSEMNGNEKYCDLPESLPTDAERPGRIQAGDLMLYGSDCLVLFYESFSSSYSYTRLGSIDDPAGLAEAVGHGSVEVRFQAG